MSKEYLFGAAPAYAPPVSGESERDRRLRLRAEERSRRLVGGEGSAYEGTEASKRDQIWEMKKLQRLAGDLSQVGKEAAPSSFNPIGFNPSQLEGFSKDAGKFENYSSKPSTNLVSPSPGFSQGYPGNQGYQGYQGYQEYQGLQGHQGLQGLQGSPGHPGFAGYQGPPGVQGNPGYPGYQAHKANQHPGYPSFGQVANPEVPDQGLHSNPSYPVDNPSRGSENVSEFLSKDQLDYADQLFTNLLKPKEQDKKKIYADELKKQIDAKNIRKPAESPEGQFEIGGRNRMIDKKAYAAELDAQVNAKRSGTADQGESPLLGYFGGTPTGLSEREKKQRYAKELEAQIRQKRQENSAGRGGNEDFFAFPSSQDSARDKKRLYAQELEAQIKGKASRPDLPRYPYQDSENVAKPDFSNDLPGRNLEDAPLLPSGVPAASVDKKNQYRLELERQIEEQKRRKEEEKKKRLMEEEVAEKRFSFVAGADPNKPISRHKTVDPNRPSEENPSADRYKQHLQRVKKPENLKQEDLQKPVVNPSSARADGRQGFEYPEPAEGLRPGLKQDNLKPFPETLANDQPWPEPLKPFNENPLMNLNRYENPGFRPESQNFYEGEKPFRNVGNSILDQKKNEMIPSHLIETYMREIQETRMERDRAREQALEMREMMLREKERNLEQLLYLVKGQNSDSRPVSYQEPRPVSQQPLHQLPSFSRNPTYEPKPVYQDFSNPMMQNKPVYSDPYNDLYKDFKPEFFRANSENPNLSAIRPQNPSAYPMSSMPPIEEPDPFEQSLTGVSKWVDPEHARWGNVSLIESVAIPGNNFSNLAAEVPVNPSNELLLSDLNVAKRPNPDFGPIPSSGSKVSLPANPSLPSSDRKKWEGKDLQDSKPPDQTPRFLYSQNQGSMGRIMVDDESLPSKVEQVNFFESKAEPFNVVQDKESDESIPEDYESVKDYSEDPDQDSSIEQTREIPMPDPKYEETDQYMVECDDWSESQEEVEAEVKRQVKNSYDKPKIFDVFKSKLPKPEKVDSGKASPVKSPKKELPPNPSLGKVAFSRLEQARKHAKELKARDVGDDIEASQAKFLDLPDFCKDSVSQSSMEGKFTQLALMELRNQKRKNNELNSSKSSLPRDSKDLHDKFFAAAYEKDKTEDRVNRVQSRRYID